MKKDKYVLGGVGFTSKEAIRQYAKTILRESAPGYWLESDQLAVISDLMGWHPDADHKIGPGVDSIQVIKPVINLPGKCFLAHRVDDTSIDFSYRVCIDKSLGSNRSNAVSAFRAAILPQTIATKREMLETMCAADGLIWSSFERKWLPPDAVALDHYPVPFADILDRFLEAENIQLEAVETVEDGYARDVKDKALRMRWQIHHRTHAMYRLISADLNAKLGRHQQTVA